MCMCRCHGEMRDTPLEEVDMAGRKLSRTREECAASHSPWLTEAVLEIKNLTVKILESCEHFYFCFLSIFSVANWRG